MKKKLSLRARLEAMACQFSPILAARVLQGSARKIMKQEGKSYVWRLNQLLVLDARLGQHWPQVQVQGRYHTHNINLLSI